ncbi:hypothetical protein ACWGH5_29040 [Streptomyces sp. NPDC054864]
MNSSISQIVIVVLGIGGTLAAAVITQRGADRARARELEYTRQLQQEEREYATRQAQLEARRTCYATLSAGTRDLANVMAKVLHALERGEVTEELRLDLDRARRDHRLRHAEAQMVLPDTVTEAASMANRHLGDLYGLLMRLECATSCVLTLGSRPPTEARRANVVLPARANPQQGCGNQGVLRLQAATHPGSFRRAAAPSRPAPSC